LAAEESDFEYKTRALCFDKNMSSTTDELKGEIDIREKHIVETCWGGSYDDSDYQSITNLTTFRDTVCHNTEGLADRFFFHIDNTSDPDLCREAVDCIETKTNDILNGLKNSGFLDGDDLDSALQDQDTSKIYGDTGDVTFKVCFDRNPSNISDTLLNCQASSEGNDCTPPTYEFDGHPECGIDGMEGRLPTCPSGLAPQFQDFGPVYPNSATESGYAAATKSIRSDYIPCELDRTAADDVGVILFLKPIFEAILIGLTAAKDSFPQDYPYVLFVFAVLIPEVIVLAFEIVLEQADYHDALIDGAEIEALYENTRQMLNASAAIYDEVVCRCIDDLESRPQSKFMSFSCVLSMVE
jgi:hypothetical protein